MKISHLRLFIIYLFGPIYVGCSSEKPGYEPEGSHDLKNSLTAIRQNEATENTFRDEKRLEQNKKLFQASNEWKSVSPDEMIPPGLYVRMNLQTGAKEAKLIEPPLEERKEDFMKSAIESTLAKLEAEGDQGLLNLKSDLWSQAGGEDVIIASEKKFTKMELKRTLKKLQNENFENVLGKDLKNILEIKKEFKEMKIDIKLDSEIVKEHLVRYNSSNVTAVDKLDILESLEYYLHQIDNANLFVDLGGLRLLIAEIKESNETLQGSLLLVLGSALQSNPRSQVVAVKEGLLELCLRVVTTTTSQVVRSRGMHTISATLRNFPYAQQKFGDLGGYESLVDLMKMETVDEKAATKVVTMITDLKDEQFFTEVDEHLHPDLKREKLKQYEGVGLVNKMLETDWCLFLPRFLTSDDVVVKEKVLNAMWSWVELCQNQFQRHRSFLGDVERQLKGLEADDGRKEFRDELLALVTKIAYKLQTRSEL